MDFLKLLWIKFEVQLCLFIFYLHFILIQKIPKKYIWLLDLLSSFLFCLGLIWINFDQLGLVAVFLPPPFHLHPFLSLNGQWVKVLRLVLTNRSLIFFDPNQTQLDPWSSELFCVKDRLLLGQANNQKSIQGPSPFVWHDKFMELGLLVMTSNLCSLPIFLLTGLR